MRITGVSTTATFGRYRVGAALGQGGMATVHEAWIDGPDGFSRRVALKRMRESARGAEDLAKLFSDEARIASHLHHANLVGIVDYGIEDGVAFQALELVEGTTLEALRADLETHGEMLPEAIAIHVVREVAHGLAYAHRAEGADGKPLGLVHRDVSPSNVLIGWNGDVKLSDFGIAFARGRQVETAHGVTRGKPSYMAPEQATRGTIDARTDLFALGCTLHFALTGKSPLEGDEVLLKMLIGERAPIDASLPEDLCELVRAAVSPERRDRPRSADAMNEQLDAAYRARASRDGRSELRAWLAPIAGRARRDVRSDPAPTLDIRPPVTPVTPVTLAPRSSRAPFGVVVGLVAIGAAIVAAIEPASPEVAVLLANDAGALDAGAVIDASTPTDAPDVFDAGVPSPPPTSHAPARRPVVSETPPPTTDVTSSGWVRVVAGCDDARGGAVEIDGHATGDQVPMTTRLRAGTHHVRVVAPSGRDFEGDVTLTGFHTEGSPAWFRACAAP